MHVRALFSVTIFLSLIMQLASCATSGVEKYAAATPEEIVFDIDVQSGDVSQKLYKIMGPSIDVRAGYGAFAKGMLRGGSNFGTSVSLQGNQLAEGGISHRIVAALQYTNLGGVYRGYHRAGIEGLEDLRVEHLDRDKQYTPNGVIMTETIGINIADSTLRTLAGADLVLRVGTDSGNLETLKIPTNYVVAYLRTIDRQAQLDNAQ